MTPKQVVLKWGKRAIRFCIINSEFFQRSYYMFQRAWYGYSDEDVFSIDFWLDEILPLAIDELIERKISCPPEFLKGNGDNGFTEEEIIAGIEEWKRVMRQIRDGFLAHQSLSCNGYHLSPEEKKEKKQKFRHGMLLMTRYYHTMWW